MTHLPAHALLKTWQQVHYDKHDHSFNASPAERFHSLLLRRFNEIGQPVVLANVDMAVGDPLPFMA